MDLTLAPYWWDEAPPRKLGHRPPAKADVVIVGGGYTGLNAAVALRRAGAEALVLEAGDFGQGASSRNAGHVSSGVNLGKSASASNVRSPLEQSLPAGIFQLLKDEAAASFDFVEARAAELARDVHYRRSGRVVCAALPLHYEAIKGKAAKMERDGVALYDRDQQRQVIGSDHYHGAMTIDRAGQLHPGHYLQGLVDLAEASGAILCDNTPVTELRRAGSGWVVTAGDSEVRCDKVLLATNGYSDRLVPWVRRRVIPAASYIVVTGQLPDGLIDRLLPKGRTAVDSRRLLSYFRPTPDRKRILFGGRASLRIRDPALLVPDLARRLHQVFPETEGVPIRYAWSGQIAFTFDLLPHLGEHNGLVYALGCNGSGVAMQSYLGHMAGQAMAGGTRSAFWNLSFPTMPFYREKAWFLPAMTGWYKFRDQLERLTGR